jgi:hypothetical protein
MVAAKSKSKVAIPGIASTMGVAQCSQRVRIGYARDGDCITQSKNSG